nr:PKD domain-containing protein [uncultured Flavobacterium sp.]
MKHLYKIIFLFVLIISVNNLNAKSNYPHLGIDKRIVAASTDIFVLPTATISGTTAVCQNATQPQITFTGAGGTGPYVFTYNINGGASLTAITISGDSVTVSAPTITAGTFIYNLVSVHDASLPLTEITQTGTAVITINPQPDASLSGTGSGTTFNGIPAFRICSNVTSPFTFSNTSLTSSTLNTNYTIDWGDGSPNFTSPSWTTTTHTYAVGYWNLTYTIQSTNSCEIIKKYVVFVGSNPAVSLGNPGNTDICNSTQLTFPISGTENNPSGTTYTISFNDGSSPITYNHPPPSTISHTFLKTSCGVTSSDGTNSYPNSFRANIVAQNPCGTSAVGVVPIYVSTPPTADFTIPTNGCTNTSVCLNNTTTEGFENNGNTNSCNTTPKFVWTISPSTGYTVVSGSIGNDFGSVDPNLWLSGSSPLCLNFSQGGTYTISIKTANRCGSVMIKTRQICIESPPVPMFSLSSTEGCGPVSVRTTNTTNITNSCTTPTYLWNVVYTAANCGTTVLYNYTSGSSTSFSPVFSFVNPGIYSISLTATNSCGSFTSAIQTITVKQPPAVSINAIADSCGATTITPTAVVQGCTSVSSTLTYAWSFPGGIPATSTASIPGAITYNTSGSYTISLIVTNECGTSTIANEVFVVNDVPALTNTTLTQTICSGTVSDLVNLNSNLTGTTFSWTAIATSGITGFTNSGTNIIPVQTLINSGTSSGTVTYIIIPKLGICNGAPTNYVITVNPAPQITVQPVSSSVCKDGAVTPLTFTLNGIIGTPTYQWYSNTLASNIGGSLILGQTNNVFTPSSSVVGSFYYYCIITLPSGGCSSLKTNVATVMIAPLVSIIAQPTPIQNLCVGVTIPASLAVSYSGGTGMFSYQWYSNTSNSNNDGTPILGATSPTYTPPVFNVPSSYFYYVIVSSNGNGCGSVRSDVSEIDVFSDPSISFQPLSAQTLCQGATPQNLQVVATGGNGIFSYQWYQSTINNTTSGVAISGAVSNFYTPPTSTVGTLYYYCLVTQNDIGCEVKSSISAVIVNVAPTITNQPASSIVCVGTTPTPLSVAYTNGVGTPQYQWFSNTVNTISGGIIISGATSNTYVPAAINIGTLYYYCVITLSSGGCSNITSNIAEVTINPNPIINAVNMIICSGDTFTVIPDNLNGNSIPSGTKYTWTNPVITPSNSVNGAFTQSVPQTMISQTLNNNTTSIATVTYTVTPVSGGCVGADFKIIVTINPAISSNVTITNSSCFGTNSGSIQTNITGGIPFGSGVPYIVSWSGPAGYIANTTNISNLSSGTYNLTIQDDGGCPFLKSYSITEPNDILITTDLKKDISCFGNANGSIAITITGGTPNYTFAWTKNGTAYETTEDLSNLGPGVYKVTVSDANNCGPKTAIFTIVEPSILALNLVSQTNILCFGDASGAITTNVVGGNAPYTYAWTGPDGFTSSIPNLTAILAGTYNLKVTDNSGCSVNLLPVTITQPLEISIVAATSPIICYGGNDASIDLTISGGISPYQTVWDTMATGTFQDNLSAGDYVITVTDTSGCEKKITVNIPNPPVFSVNPIVKQISCFGAKDASINLNLVGGLSPVKLVWNDGSTSGLTRNNLGPGTYIATITDGKPCVITKTFIIQEPQPLVVGANITNALDCSNANSGAINLLVSGGTAPYSYVWNNGSVTEDLNNVPGGNYMVTVTDSRGCVQTKQYVITRPDPISIDVSTQLIFDCNVKTVSLKNIALASGGVPPFIYDWSSGTVSGIDKTVMETNQNGVVILMVTDALGCSANKTLNIDVPKIGSTSFASSSYANTTYGSYSIQDPIQFANTATGDYETIVWDFGDGSVSNEENPIHTFVKEGNYVVTQTVAYAFGCEYKYTITLNIDKGYKLITPNGFTPNNDGINETFKPVFIGITSIQLEVYDTWGELIYTETGETLRGWDGKIKGKESENGNYYYKVKASTFYGGIINENGPFTLIK